MFYKIFKNCLLIIFIFLFFNLLALLIIVEKNGFSLNDKFVNNFYFNKNVILLCLLTFAGGGSGDNNKPKAGIEKVLIRSVGMKFIELIFYILVLQMKMLLLYFLGIMNGNILKNLRVLIL